MDHDTDTAAIAAAMVAKFREESEKTRKMLDETTRACNQQTVMIEKSLVPAVKQLAAAVQGLEQGKL